MLARPPLVGVPAVTSVLGKVPVGELRFLAGGGEMGARIRAYDWSATPLGPIDRWPQALRSALDLCLNSSFPTAIYWGQELRLLYNDAWAPIPALKHPWALGQPARAVWDDIWDIIAPQLEQVMSKGEGISAYDQMLPMERGGQIEETYWNYSFTPLRNERGLVLGVFNQGHETTAKVLAERAHEGEILRLRELFEQAPGAVTLLRGPEHVFEIANAAYLRLIGRGDILGKRVIDVIPEAVEQGFLDLLDWVYRTGEPYYGASIPVALKLAPDAASEDRVLDFIYQPIKSESGLATGIFVQATDVTERTHAEAALRASEENLRRLNERLEALVAERTAALSETLDTLQAVVNRMRTTFQTSFVFQGYMSPDGTLLEANAASLEGAGARPEDVIGKPFWMTPWFTDTPGMPEMVKDAVQSVAAGVSMRRTIVVRLPGGERTFDFSMRPVKNEQGNVIGIVPEAVDLTQLLQTEERLRQSQKMEAVGQLTGGIAHDFNNLLTGIIGSLDMMERRIAQGRLEKVDEYIKAAITSANRAAALTHRLLAFARRQPLDPKPVAVNTLIADMEDMLRRTLGEKVRLEISTGGDAWLTRCDPNQLESAILNLVINARDAMPQGGQIAIGTGNAILDERHASTASWLLPGDYVRIRVTDTGQGMPPDVIAKAFDPFFTTKPLGQGTGLGLSMIYGFIKQSGGHVTIESEQGAGTTVEIYLPRYRGEPPAAKEDASVSGTYRAFGSDTVLVVEDEPIVRRLILGVLSELGYRALEAPDGAAGLEVLQSDERIDLLITDVGLPEIDGHQMVHRARETRPRLKVLFITGYAEQAMSGTESIGHGIQMITKPFSMEALTQRVQEMVGRG